MTKSLEIIYILYLLYYLNPVSLMINFTQLESADKTSRLNSFRDVVLSSGNTLIDLVDAIIPASVDYQLVKQGNNEQVRNRYMTTTIL